jgi:hypothetical protein
VLLAVEVLLPNINQYTTLNIINMNTKIAIPINTHFKESIKLFSNSVVFFVSSTGFVVAGGVVAGGVVAGGVVSGGVVAGGVVAGGVVAGGVVAGGVVAGGVVAGGVVSGGVVAGGVVAGGVVAGGVVAGGVVAGVVAGGVVAGVVAGGVVFVNCSVYFSNIFIKYRCLISSSLSITFLISIISFYKSSILRFQ